MDRIRNNKALCFLVALFLIIGLMPMTGTAFADTASYQVDSSMMDKGFTNISITADLHLLGNNGQNNRDRLETYLKGIQGFGPDLLIICGDQFEEAYLPPEEGEYSSEASIGWDFTDITGTMIPDNPYDEIRDVAENYLGEVPIVFVRGNNDYNAGNNYDQNAGYPFGSANHFGLVETRYLDVFRFGAPDSSSSYNYSSDEINGLDQYLKNRTDKSKLVLVAGHYPIDDGKSTPTNNKDYYRNAGNSDQVKAVLENYDQPVVFLWSHNHDTGPDSEEYIFKSYGSGYWTMNSGAVGYKDTEEYVQGINITLDNENKLVSYSMWRYGVDGISSIVLITGQELPSVEPWSQGSGTAEDPYVIDSAEQLRYLGLMVNNGEDYSGKYFRQAEDIDLSGENWKPIGKYVSSSTPNDARNRAFSGIYDGNGCIIAGLTIDQNLVGSSLINKGYGLFGFLTGSVRNLGMTDINIDAEISGSFNIYAGGIAGYVGYYDTEAGFIENCYVNGTIHAAASLRSCAGGLAGYLRRGEILNSCSSVGANNIPGTDYSGAGGLIGYREIPKDGFIINGYWDTSMTSLYGITYGNNVEGLSISGITTDQMKGETFIDLLNQNALTLGDGYIPWMSDQYTNLNNGYPIHEREVLLEPVIDTNPADTASLANGATVQVSISSIIPTHTIWYTTDGTDPTDENSTRIEYTSPFALSTTDTAGETKTIKAVTTNGNGTYSTIAVKLVKFLAAPAIPGGGSGGGGSGGGSGGSSSVTPIPEVTPPLELLPMPDITDITGHWAESGIRKAFGLGFVNGYLDKTFRPERQITRAEFLTMLVKALGMTTPKAISWADVDQHWAKEQIQIAAQNGIVEGLGGNLFGPDQAITREQMTVMLARAMRISTATQKSSFRDGKDISAWALNDIDAATQWKLILGYEDSTFRPQGSATRAEAVEIIIRALAYQENLNKSVNGAQ